MNNDSNDKQDKRRNCREQSPIRVCGKGGALQEFANDTSAHGLGHTVSKKRGPIRRFIWLLACLVSFGYLLFQLVFLIRDIKSYPFKTVNKVTPRTSLIFPTITFCDLNFAYANKFKNSEEVKTIFRVVDPINWGPFFNTTLDDLRLQDPYKSLLQTRFLDFINKGAPTVHDSFAHCHWQEKTMNCSDLLTYIVTPIGRCFKFNSNWSNPTVTHRSGSKGGLYLVLRIDQKAYTSSFQYAAGFMLLLRHMYDYPDVFSNGLLISPGFHYGISFQLYTYKYLPKPYKALGDRHCSNPDPADYGLNTQEYSLSACILNRSEIKTMEICGCSIDNCTLDEYLTCFRPHFTMIYQDGTQGDLLGCAYPCFRRSYMPVISQALIPTPGASEVIRAAYPDIPDEEMRGTFVTVNLHYEDLIVRESEHVPEYDSLSILGTVGGNMGLFLGASFLTLAEVAELIVFLFLNSLNRRLRQCFPGTPRDS